MVEHLSKTLGSVSNTKKETETEGGGGKRREEKYSRGAGKKKNITVTFHKWEPIEILSLARFQQTDYINSAISQPSEGQKVSEGEE